MKCKGSFIDDTKWRKALRNLLATTMKLSEMLLMRHLYTKFAYQLKLKKTISSDKIRLECTQKSMTFSLLTLTKATLKLAINYITENIFI